MDFPREELLEKYISIYEKWVSAYEPNIEEAGGMTRYVKYNNAWSGLDPFGKFLISKLTRPKDTFPKRPAAKIAGNANPDDYLTLRYDSDGVLKAVYYPKISGGRVLAFFYVSKQLTIGYWIDYDKNGAASYDMYNFEWYEYDDAGRLISAEEFRGDGTPADDVIINSEYYTYDDGILSHAWYFKEYQKYPMEMTVRLVKRMMPDRIIFPDRFEYSFQRVEDGLDFTCTHYYRKSQTITDNGHVSEEKICHLSDNGIHLV